MITIILQKGHCENQRHIERRLHLQLSKWYLYYCFELLIQIFEFYIFKIRKCPQRDFEKHDPVSSDVFDAIDLPEGTDQRRPFLSQDGGRGCQLEGGSHKDIGHPVSPHKMRWTEALRHSLRPTWARLGSGHPLDAQIRAQA